MNTQANLLKKNSTLQSQESLFTFSDLFAGIGGFRLGLERLRGKCVFSCEWDKYAQQTYYKWFDETPIGDINSVNASDIPRHHILTGGFPCQPFSIAGVSKKKSLGREHGFKDKTQGNLFFNIAEIASVIRPPILFLENVKNLKSHDKGKTWKIICETIDELGYELRSKIIDAKWFVPQHRERIFLVCFDREVFGDQPDFSFPEVEEKAHSLKDILESKPDDKYILSDHLWKYLQDYAAKHRARGNGFGYGLPDLNGISRTLSARYYKDGSEVLIQRGEGENPRRLTPREAAKLMGFPDDLPIVVSDTQAYKQFGNAVVPHVVEAIGVEILKTLKSHSIVR
ncbi:DNA (cytosine-5-)-methyltransferase [bacterium]|nr:DNA (cytosine-5-)-methyltransferase [bacterium]